jgi:NADH:ubiquinone oxidoreductase subunit F (NADH-binding)/NADH:ubiquinone oxidoreductase subunit E
MSNKHQRYKPIDPQIQAIASLHGNNPVAILEIFKDIQAAQGNLSQEAITDTARVLKLPAARAFGVASFYSMLTLQPKPVNVVRVCDGPVCWLKGSHPIHQELATLIQTHIDWTIERSSCLGLCDRAPAALINDDQAGPLDKQNLQPVLGGWRGTHIDYTQSRPGEHRIMLSKTGLVDPDSIESALDHGAYCGLGSALSRSPEDTLAEVESSGLTGRGGAGFPVGRKWRFVALAENKPKYVVCNADESEPLIFKDRVLIDTNPHQILEGMAIAGYATGSSEAFIYIRGEYSEQANRLENAIHQAEELGWLGNNIAGSKFSFHIHVHRGAGAYICGEETALIESLEGKPGEPRMRPPYPPAYGYQGYPTLVNNVESYAAVPPIICNGAEWFRKISSYPTPGTKLYMLLGHVNKPGIFEAPFGLTLRQVIDDFGGGMPPGSTFNFALTGGAAGTIASSAHLDIPIDYGSFTKGISLGAGAFLVCDQSVSPLEFLRNLIHFFAVESCGKCTPCRVGTHQLEQRLIKMSAGKITSEDSQAMLDLVETMQVASFCGLGQSVILPVKSAITQFPAAFAPAS